MLPHVTIRPCMLAHLRMRLGDNVIHAMPRWPYMSATQHIHGGVCTAQELCTTCAYLSGGGCSALLQGLLGLLQSNICLFKCLIQ